MKILEFLKTHTTIRTKAILLVYIIVVFYKFAYSLFQFSLVRFLKAGIGQDTFLIGLMIAISNFILLFSDIPLGILQKYFKPRRFLLVSIGMLLISDLIFLFATLDVWLGFIAVFFQQASMEIYFITITTYILRLSTKDDYAQNVSQEDMADNIGDILGLGLGGVVFVIDRFFDANNVFAASFLAILIMLLFLFVYEFVDHKHFTSMEETILNLRVSKQFQEGALNVSEQIVQNPTEEAPADEITKKGKMSFGEIADGFRTTFGNLFDILTNKLHTPLLLWGIAIMVITYFWYASINFFEPMFMKEIYNEGTGWIVDNVPRYMFESFMFIIALVVPTFFLELPFGKLADKWGKEKMIILGTLFSGISIFILGLIPNAFIVFLIFLAINCGFVIIYPSTVGLLGEEYKKASDRKKQEEGKKDIAASQEEQVEGESAGIISIIVNFGEIAAGLVGGFFLGIFSFSQTYIIYGIFLLAIGGLSILAFKYLFPGYNEKDVKPDVPQVNDTSQST